MSKQSLSKIVTCLTIIIGLTSLGVGIWEAITAQENNPKNTKYHDDMIQGYAFCIAKCVLNIIFGICVFFSGVVMCCFVMSNDDDFTNSTSVTFTVGKDNKKNKSSSESILQVVNLGVGIWGLVMYFNNYDLGPFKKIIFAEMIIFFVSLGIVVSILFGACCFMCCSCASEAIEVKTITKLPQQNVSNMPNPSANVTPSKITDKNETKYSVSTVVSVDLV